MEKPDTPAGPAPVRGTSATFLSRPRGAVLERVQRSMIPVTVAVLAEEMGTHPNTVRGHLDGLADQGLVQRARAPVHGRRRPAWQYTAAGRAEADQRVRDYAGLATALAGRLAATAADPPAEGLAAGRDWGLILAAGLPAPGPGSEESPRHRVVELLAELGFAPKSDPAASTVTLHRCPLLDAARAHTEVVCAVHLGIVRGVLEVLGGDPEPTALLPFSEPGACRLYLDTGLAGVPPAELPAAAPPATGPPPVR